MKKGSILLLILLIFASGCGLIMKEKQNTDAFMESYFETIKRRDFQGALKFYSEKFFEVISPEAWLSALKDINSKLGNLQSYTLLSWNITKNLQGTSYKIKYKVKYAKHIAEETFILYRPIGSKQIKIQAHHIKPSGL
jgi:hypothetical protein